MDDGKYTEDEMQAYAQACTRGRRRDLIQIGLARARNGGGNTISHSRCQRRSIWRNSVSTGYRV